MDILTLGKMNQMAKDVDATLEYMANATFDTLRDVCVKQVEIEATQSGQVTCLDSVVATGVNTLVNLGGGGNGVHEFMLMNDNHWTVLNGGCCLEWTVPANVKSIKFEALGGGGPGGSSGGDHDVTVGGQGGGYSAKTLYASDNDFVGDGTDIYTLCSGGTSDCSCCCQCCMNQRQGCTSYATGPGLSNFCAMGGLGGSTPWDKMSNCYDCHMSTQCCASNYDSDWGTQTINEQSYGADICFKGSSGSYTRGYSCCNEVYGYSGGPTGPFAVSGSPNGGQACTQCSGCRGGHSLFPGGGGQGHATASPTGCWGGFGAGGLLKVTYA